MQLHLFWNEIKTRGVARAQIRINNFLIAIDFNSSLL